MSQFTFVDLFAGAGGLSLGFLRAGFVSVGAYDSWDPALETHRANFDDQVHGLCITREIEIPACDVIVGGPPCQGFSSAGLRRVDDKRNTLVGEFSHLIARVRPKAFVFENVEGFLTGADGFHVFELLEPLVEAGYFIHLRKVNAAHYGVPQHRKRVIAIGGFGWEPSFPTPTHAAFGAPGARLGNGSRRTLTPTLGDALKGLPPAQMDNPLIPDHDFAPLSESDLRRARMLKPGECMWDLPEELWHESYERRAFRRVMDGTPTEKRGGPPSGVRRLKPDEPSKAITGGALRDFIHPSEDRPLTIRECATLQTFPLDFRFLGNRNDKIKLIGNAVPPLLAQCVAASLALDLAQQRDVVWGRGRLLSFVPTLAAGMSPILSRVTDRIRERFGIMDDQQYELAL